MESSFLPTLHATIHDALHSDAQAAAEFMNAYTNAGYHKRETPFKNVLDPSFHCPSPVALDTHDSVDAHTGITSRSGILLGVVRSDEKGGLFLCAPSALGGDNISRGSARLVVAPPPSPSYHNATVWCKDWRRLPLPPSRSVSSACPGVFEILLVDLHILRRRVPDVGSFSFQSVESLDESPRGEINLHGFVRCKSSILAGRRSKPAFLVEFGRDMSSSSIVFLAFLGDQAVRWWPFICPGNRVALVGLQLVTLPKKGNKKLLGALGSTRSNLLVLDASIQRLVNCNVSVGGVGSSSKVGEFDSATREHVNDAALPSSYDRPLSPVVSRKGSDQMLASYAGVISKVIGDGRFELDNSLVLHLGAYGGWCAGPEAVAICLRSGAHVNVQHAKIGFRRGRPSVLFTTARSIVYVVYFGALPDVAAGNVKTAQSYRDSPWRTHWRELKSEEIVWAEELYVSLGEKFGPWFAAGSSEFSEDAPSGESQWRDVLLGLSGDVDPGLVRQVMEMEGIHGVRAQNHPDVYDEFMELSCDRYRFKLGSDGNFPFLPTVRKVAHAFDVVTLQSSMRRRRTHGVEHAPVTIEFFYASDIDIAEVLLGKNSCRIHEEPWECTRKRMRFVEGFLPTSIGDKDDDNFVPCDVFGPAGRPSIVHSVCCNLPPSGRTKCLVSNWMRQETSGLSLVGVLEAVDDSEGRLRLFDVSASLDVLAIGPLSPDVVGAIVRVSRFMIFAAEHPHSRYTRVAIFDSCSLEVVLPGPYSISLLTSGEPECLRSQYGVIPSSMDRGGHLIVPQTQRGTTPNIEGSMIATLAESTDTRPIVAIYVSDITVVRRSSDGDLTFCVHGRLLACKQSRRSRQWIALGDDVVGFLECALVLTGRFAAGLSIVLQTNSAFAVTCTSLPCGSDVRKSVWNLCGPVEPSMSPDRSCVFSELSSIYCPPHGVFLASGAGSSRPWVEQLSCQGREICFESGSLVDGEEDAIEAAISSWLSDPDSAESRKSQYMDFVEVSGFPDVYPPCVVGPESVTMISFTGVVASVQYSYVDEGCNRPQGSILLVRDMSIPVLQVRLYLDSTVCVPSCLSPGVPVHFRRIRFSTSAGIGAGPIRKRLTLTPASSVRVLAESVDSLLIRESSTLCCSRPLDIDRMMARIPEKLLWHYTDEHLRLAPSDRPGLGCLRVRNMEIKRVGLSRRKRKLGEPVCASCGDSEVVINAELEAYVCDGTARARLLCQGFTNVLDLLCATDRERYSLLKFAREQEAVEYEYIPPTKVGKAGDCRVSFWSPRQQAQKLLGELVARSRCRNFVLIARPHEALRDLSVALTMDHGVNLGFGRKLFTSGLPGKYQPDLECVAVFQDAAWNESARNGKSFFSSASMVAKLLCSSPTEGFCPLNSASAGMDKPDK